MNVAPTFSCRGNARTTVRAVVYNVAQPPRIPAGTSPRFTSLASKLPPRERLPQHIAVIMDGNARWASAHGLPTAVGHQRGVEALRLLVQCCREWAIPCLTVFALSAENIRRPPQEVEYLMSLFERVLQNEVDELVANGVQLKFIGEIEQLPMSLQNAIAKTVDATANNSELQFNVAINYGSKQDLTYAIQRLSRQVAKGRLNPDDINVDLIATELSTQHIAKPLDLMIRTAGERRLSNFLLFEAAYSELYFSDILWPDFSPQEFAAALIDYSRRQRRFGVR